MGGIHLSDNSFGTSLISVLYSICPEQVQFASTNRHLYITAAWWPRARWISDMGADWRHPEQLRCESIKTWRLKHNAYSQVRAKTPLRRTSNVNTVGRFLHIFSDAFSQQNCEQDFWKRGSPCLSRFSTNTEWNRKMLYPRNERFVSYLWLY